MEKTPFSRFIDLITFDQSLLVLEKKLAQVTTVLENTQEILSTLEREHDKERLVLYELKKYVDEQELEMRSLDEQEKTVRERASLATTQKEYQGFKKEGDQFKNLQHEHEDILVAAWTNFENAQKLFTAKEQHLKEKKATLLQEIQTYQEQQKLILEEIAQYEVARQAYTQDVPQEWFDKYNRMRNVVSNPVVPIIAGTCGGCSYMLRVQTVMSLDQNKMIECSGCYRLMYKNFEQPA